MYIYNYAGHSLHQNLLRQYSLKQKAGERSGSEFKSILELKRKQKEHPAGLNEKEHLPKLMEKEDRFKEKIKLLIELFDEGVCSETQFIEGVRKLVKQN
jgi:hypothetical protein